jgi:hypothetical protein
MAFRIGEGVGSLKSTATRSSSEPCLSAFFHRKELKEEGLQERVSRGLSLRILSQERKPTYKRALFSDGAVKAEGMLKPTRNIDEEMIRRIGAQLAALRDDTAGDMALFLSRLETLASIEITANKLPNVLVSLAEICPEGIKDGMRSKTSTFYSYNGEGSFDYSWGCCWRSTQTSLSAAVGEPGRLKEVPAFEHLFHLFGREESLRIIYEDFLKARTGLFGEELEKAVNEVFEGATFSPYQHVYGWGNPFVSQLMMHYYGFSSELFVVNDIPDSLKHRKVTDRVSAGTFNTFEPLKAKLLEHFSEENPMPVIVDDGLFAMSIVGASYSDGETMIWMGDPHIKGGGNNEDSPLIYNTEDPKKSLETTYDALAGLYTVTLDERGRQIRNSVVKHAVMFSKNSYNGTEFMEKSWMVLFPRR